MPLQKSEYIRIHKVKNCDHEVPNTLTNVTISMPQKGKMVVSGAFVSRKTANVLPVSIVCCILTVKISYIVEKKLFKKDN